MIPSSIVSYLHQSFRNLFIIQYNIPTRFLWEKTNFDVNVTDKK